MTLRMPGTPMYPIAKPRPTKAGEAPEKVVFPEDSLCYLLGNDGVYKQVRNLFYDVIVKEADFKDSNDDKKDKDFGFLASIEETVDIKVYKLGFAKLVMAGNFFSAVWDKSKAEAVVLLYYNPTTHDWKIGVPKQSGTGGHVDYDASNITKELEENPGYFPFGTIHSHCNFSAFHSRTDNKDEFHFDGLHITIGHVDGCFLKRDYACRWIFAGKDFKTDIDGCIEGYPTSFPQAWLDLHEKKPITAPVSVGPSNAPSVSTSLPSTAASQSSQGTAPDHAITTNAVPKNTTSSPENTKMSSTRTQTPVTSLRGDISDSTAGGSKRRSSSKGSNTDTANQGGLVNFMELSDQQIEESFAVTFPGGEPTEGGALEPEIFSEALNRDESKKVSAKGGTHAPETSDSSQLVSDTKVGA